LTAIPPKIPTGSAFASRLALFYAAVFVAMGLQMPLFPLWLTARGLDAQMIGVLLALPWAVRIVAVPLMTRAADRHDAVRGGLMMLTVAAALFNGLLGLCTGAIAIALVYAFAASAWTGILPLADAYAVRGLRAHGRAYGPVRLWGSAAFVAASFATGALIDLIAPTQLIWFMAGAMVAMAGAAATLAPQHPGEPVLHKERRPTPLLRIPGFVAVALAAGLVHASHSVFYGFSTLAWREEGLDGTLIGGLWGLSVMAEIALFAFSARLPARVGPTVLLIAGAVGATVRWFAMAFGPPVWLLPVLQCLHGLSFGATHLGGVTYLARAAPPGAGASAQGALSVVQGVVVTVAMAMSGVLFAALGNGAYGVMAAVSAAGGVAALVAHRRLSP